MATSASPSKMLWLAEMMACRPEPHRRLTLKAGVPSAQPPLTAATRDKYMSRASVLTTWPKTTWPTSLPSTPARASDSRTTSVASSIGGVSLRLAPKVPMAVRTPLTTTTSRLMTRSPLIEIIVAQCCVLWLRSADSVAGRVYFGWSAPDRVKMYKNYILYKTTGLYAIHSFE